MFTGIIEQRGWIESINAFNGDMRMCFSTSARFMENVNTGDSIAVNGICLTAVELGKAHFHADVSAETMGATTARKWRAGQPVNLEPALTLESRVGGHLVSGHVDGIAKLSEREDESRSVRMRFSYPPELARYIARKGSVTIDGVSLTVNDVDEIGFGVNIVPHTLSATTLGELEAGSPVNLEVDLIARYLERLVAARTD